MANATAKVNKSQTSRATERHDRRSTETLASETTFYVNALIGTDTTGYLCKGDDTQSWLLAGVVRGREGNPVIPAGTAGDEALLLDVEKPRYMELAIASVAVTDIGKTVYASFDQTGVLTSASLTYANVVGTVVDVVASGIARVEMAYDGLAANVRLMASKWLAATGNQTLSKFDVGKTIFLPNTAAYSVTLPAVADVPVGAWLQFVKTTTDAEIVTLDGADSENIDGATTLGTIDAAYDCARLVNTGVRWIITARDIA